MNALDQAFHWYRSTKDQLQLLQRLARRYWQQLPWDLLSKDDHFRSREGPNEDREAADNLRPLDDLAVLLMFSAFETIVRDHVVAEVENEAQHLKHFALRIAASEEIERLRDGSFFHVLEPFKAPDHDLVEQVNQVRRYRNWVAHGRRGDAPAFVDPAGAYDRLTRFLSLVGIDATNDSLVQTKHLQK